MCCTFFDGQNGFIAGLEAFSIGDSQLEFVHSFHNVGQSEDGLMITVVDHILNKQTNKSINNLHNRSFTHRTNLENAIVPIYVREIERPVVRISPFI